MEKQITIVVPNASGEEGLTLACKRGDLFRNNVSIENHYRDGYHIYDYKVMDVDSAEPAPHTTVQVIMKKWLA